MSVFSKSSISLLCAGLIALTTTPAFSQDALKIEADDSLEWNQTEGFYQANGNAAATQGTQSLRGDRLTAFYVPTESNRELNRILAEGRVNFKDGTLSGAGTTADYDIASNHYILTGPAAYITGPDGRANADKQIDFERNNSLIILQENAHIKMKDGRELFGDHITVFLDENENLSRVLAKGGVKVIQNASSSARGDEADYDHKGNVTVLTGNVTLIDGENKLSGDVAEIDFSTGISKIISSTSSGRVSGQFSRLKTDAQK